MLRRIEAHRRHRPQDWLVVEEPLALGQVLGELAEPGRCLVVDCLTLWLTNLLSHADPARLGSERIALLEALPALAGDLVLVGNETNMGVIPLGEISRRYCDEAGLLHQALAARCDRVVLVVTGLPQLLKGPSLDVVDTAGGWAQPTRRVPSASIPQRFPTPERVSGLPIVGKRQIGRGLLPRNRVGANRVENDRFVDLLRHGAVVSGERFRGVADARLSARGFAQMHAAAARSGRGVGRHSPLYDALFSSPARRCAEPARELAARHGLPLELMPELSERRFGAWENRLAGELPSAELKRFWDDPAGFTPPGAEPFEALRERVLRGWDRILGHRTDFPLVVTHGGVIRVILGQILDLSAAAMMRIEVPPACRTRLRVPVGEGRPSLIFHGGAEPCGAVS